MDIIAVVYQILMMLIVMGLGLVLRRIGVMSPQVIHGISGIVLKAAMPAMLLMMVQKDVGQDLRGDFLSIAGASFLCFCAGLMIVYFALKGKVFGDRLPVFAGVSALPNVGYMGLPIVQAVYGDLGALYLAAVVVALNVCIYLMLELIMTGKPPRPAALFRNAGLILSLFALAALMLDIKLPMPLSAVVTQLGGMTTPLSMLVAGARLMDFRPAVLKEKELWGAILLRLLVLPMLSFALFKALGFEGVALGVLTLACAMPGAVATQMYAEREKKDALFGATGISIGTLLCLGTIPLVLMMTGLGG